MDKRAAIENMRRVSAMTKEAIPTASSGREGKGVPPVAVAPQVGNVSTLPVTWAQPMLASADVKNQTTYSPVIAKKSKLSPPTQTGRKSTKTLENTQLSGIVPDKTGSQGNRRPAGVSGIIPGTPRKTNFGTGMEVLASVKSIPLDRAALLHNWRYEHGMEKVAIILPILRGGWQLGAAALRGMGGAAGRTAVGGAAVRGVQNVGRFRAGMQGGQGVRAAWAARKTLPAVATKTIPASVSKIINPATGKAFVTPARTVPAAGETAAAVAKPTFGQTAKGLLTGVDAAAVAPTTTWGSALAQGAWRGGIGAAKDATRMGAGYGGLYLAGQGAGALMDPNSQWGDPERKDFAHNLGMLGLGGFSRLGRAAYIGGDIARVTHGYEGPSYGKYWAGAYVPGAELWKGNAGKRRVQSLGTQVAGMSKKYTKGKLKDVKGKLDSHREMVIRNRIAKARKSGRPVNERAIRNQATLDSALNAPETE